MKSPILFISPTNCFFGAEKELQVLFKHINKEKFDPIIVLPPNCTYKNRFSGISREIVEINIRYQHIMGNILSILETSWKLIRIVKSRNIRCVHFNGFTRWEALAIFIFFLKISRIPFIYHNHMHYSYNFLERFLIMQGTMVCVSKTIQNNFLKKRRSDFITKPSPQKIITIYPGLEVNDTVLEKDVVKFKRDFSISSEKVIGIIGAISPRKRLDLFLRIAEKVKKTRVKVKFLIVGEIYYDHDIPYKKKIVNMCNDLNLEKDVIFTGYREDIPVVLAATDILVHTSKREALGLVLIQAMTSGRPVVAFASEGPSEIIDDGKNGYLIHADNPEEYAEKIIGLLKDGKRLEQMGAAGKEKIDRMFNMNSFISQFENLYQNLIDQRK